MFAKGRHPALDVARGLAVLCMMYEHFVPMDTDNVAWQVAAARVAEIAWGKSAPLFCVLVGIGVCLQVQQEYPPPAVNMWSRALALGVIGLIMGATIWPTEILLSIGMMTVLIWPVSRRRPAVFITIVLLLATPFLNAIFADYIKQDWLADESHLGETQFGWVTLRYFFIDGHYPILQWLVFPLVGVIFATADWTKAQWAKRCFWLSSAAAIGFQIAASWGDVHKQTLPHEFRSTWAPTSLLFVLLGASSALAVISGLVWWQCQGAKMRHLFAPLRLVGRTSLTHYVLHICLIAGLLRLFYPDEEWPVGVGLLTFAAYLVAAVPLTFWWLDRFPRGPIENLLALASGRPSTSDQGSIALSSESNSKS